MIASSVGVVVLLGLGLVVFPQFRVELAVVIPFAPLLICLAMCPIMMYFGMRGHKDQGDTMEK